MPLHDIDDPFESIVVLSPDGKLEGVAVAQDQRRAPESWNPPAAPPLELNPDGYPIPKEPEVPDEAALAQQARARQHQQLAIGAAVIVILFAAAAFFLLRPRETQSAGAPAQVAATAPAASAAGPAPLAAGAAPVDGAAAFTVQSEPPGATVLIGDEILGTTPFVGTNDVAFGEQAKIRLELRGYADWTGEVTGGRNVNLLAHLKRK